MTVTAKSRLFAKGRLKAGVMNKTESRYCQYLDNLRHSGQLAWYAFEGVKFRLANACFYTPDFAVLLPDGELQCHEIKGSRAIIQDDAKAKIKIAAELYPVRFFLVFPDKYGGWEVVDV